MSKSIFQLLIELEGDTKARQAFQDLGTEIGLAGAALTAFSGLATKAASDFEFAMSKVKTLATDATGSSKDFGQSLFELSENLSGAISVTEAAGASYEILSSGFSEQADILGILEKSQKAAIGGFSDLGTVSDATAKILNVYGDTMGENLSVTEKANRITNQMIATQNLGAITVDTYARFIGNVASSARASGVSLEELNAVVALNTSKGQRASTVMDVLKTALAAFARPTEDAKKTAEELGIQFDSTALQAKGLEGVVLDLAKSGAGMAELTRLFGSAEAANVMIALVQNAEQYSQFVDNMGESVTLLDANFETMNKTAQQSLTNLQNTFQNTLVSLGSNTLIAFKPAIEALNQLLVRFNELPESTKGTIGQLILLTGGTMTLVGGLGVLLAAMSSVAASVSALGTVMAGAAASSSILVAGLAKQTVALAMTSVSFGKVFQAIGAYTLGLQKATMAMGTMNMASLATGLTSIKTGFMAATSAVWAARAGIMATSVALGGITAAVYLAAKAFEHYDNIASEERNTEKLLGLDATEKLTQDVVSLGLEIQKTGKSLPKAEFEAWLKILQDAQNTHGNMNGIIEAFTQVQNRAIQKEQERAKATQASTLLNKDNGESEEDKKARLEDFMAAQGLLIEQTQARLELEKSRIELSSSSEEETISRTLQAQTQAASELIRLNQEVADNAELSAEDRAKAEMEVARQTISIQTQTKQSLDRLAELAFEQKQSQASRELALAESVARQSGMTELEALESTQDEYDRLFQVRESRLKEQLAQAGQNSAERAKLESELADLTIQANERVMAIEKARQAQLLDGLQARKTQANTEMELAEASAQSRFETEVQFLQSTQDEWVASIESQREVIQTQIENTREGTNERASLEAELAKLTISEMERVTQTQKALLEEQLTNLGLGIQAQTSMLEGLTGRFQNFSSGLSGSTSYLDSIQSSLGQINSLMNDENTSLETKSKLQQISLDTLSRLRDFGIDIRNGASLEESLKLASLEIDQAKLQIQDQILAAKSRELTLEAQIQALKQQGIIQENQLKLESGTLTETESRQAQLAIDIARQNLTLEQQRLEMGLRNIELQRQANQLNQQINTAQGARGMTPQAQNQQTLNLTPLTQSQEKTTQAITNLTQATTGSSQKQILAQNQANQNISRGVQVNQQVVNQLAGISVKMDRLIASVNVLPGAIAARIPRPAPSR